MVGILRFYLTKRPLKKTILFKKNIQDIVFGALAQLMTLRLMSTLIIFQKKMENLKSLLICVNNFYFIFLSYYSHSITMIFFLHYFQSFAYPKVSV
jgi:hypothetical protein